MRNRKGFAEVMALVWVAAIVVGGLVTWLVGPQLVKATGAALGKGQAQHSTMVKKAESKPVIYYTDPKTGAQYVAYATKSEESNIATNEDPKPTLWERMLGLGKIWIVLMVLGIFFPPVAAIMHIVNSKAMAAAKTAYDDLKGETVKIVQSVQAARAVVPDPAVKAAMNTAMDKAQNDSTKTLVADIKANGTITTL